MQNSNFTICTHLIFVLTFQYFAIKCPHLTLCPSFHEMEGANPRESKIVCVCCNNLEVQLTGVTDACPGQSNRRLGEYVVVVKIVTYVSGVCFTCVNIQR